ncbi:MAG: hypothetical protein ABH834_02460 [Candidatus Altiarchaeota archaeon]
MARGGPKRNYNPENRKPKHNWKNEGGDRKKMLDMKREKYFGFDLKDLMDEFQLGENAGAIGATIQNKASIHSIDDALEYINRMEEAGTLDGKQVERLEMLLRKYSRWR